MKQISQCLMFLINFAQMMNSADKEKSYRISFDDSKGYLIVTHKKEYKCIICGKMSKSGNARSFKKGRFDKFICSDCLESFIIQYSKSTKTISLNKFIKNKVAWKQKLDKFPETKCRLCGAIIKLPKWKSHLRRYHKVGDSPEFKQFFIKPDADIYAAQKIWYNSGSSILHNVSCGTKVNGGPEAKIIFNATFSNRKKF